MALYTKWAEDGTYKGERWAYPRPQMQRKRWTCLNGTWEYQIVKGEEDTDPAKWQKIAVPFALGTPLSGTDVTLQLDETLWYRRTFAYDPRKKKVLLHFEAVDQVCTVFLNGMELGSHLGGYNPFTFDVTAYIKYQNALMVRVTDQTDQGIFNYGKQSLNPKGIWYHSYAGIWDTVWLEDLPAHAVEDVILTPDYDRGLVEMELAGTFEQAKITVTSKDGYRHEGLTIDGHYTIPMKAFHPWTPQDPYLYDVEIRTEDDIVMMHYGMRKFSIGKDDQGYTRFFLNDKPLFLSGILDQGMTPDGGCTYISDQGLKEELQAVKDMGFNMVRMHVLQASRRFYWHCDNLGLIVMQDMPNGGNHFSMWQHQAAPLVFGKREMNDRDHHKFGRESEHSRKAYIHELDEMVRTLYNTVCVGIYVPFNEGWGQFDSEDITARIRQLDPSRVVDSASGWHDQGCGDINSYHVYFKKFKMPKLDDRALFLSEFGGYAYQMKNHCDSEEVFGYKKFHDRCDYDRAVNALFERDILPYVEKGLAGCVYTQLTDTETECNGLITADRRVIKVDVRRMKKLNDKIIRRLK